MELKSLNILLADDDTDDCCFFREAVEALSISMNLNIVNDGDQLMNYLSENTSRLPNIIFLDINMPRKNGMESLQEMKKIAAYDGIAVIMFSTSNDWDTINRLFKSGAHVYIHKPSDFAQLKQVIHHALPLAAEKIFSNGPVKYILNA